MPLLGAGVVLPGPPPAAATGTRLSTHHRAAQRTADATTPLTVSLSSLTPSTVPRRGQVVVSGVVTNTGTESWSGVTLVPFVSTTPITTRDDLALAASTEPTTPVGQRIEGDGLTAGVGELKPGSSRSFTLRLPRGRLPITGDPGAYWFGVDAVGTGTTGSAGSTGATTQGPTTAADAEELGRARTFLPLVGQQAQRTRTVPVTLVLPLRERARRAADGSLTGVARWDSLLDPEGRLTRLAAFGASAPGGSLTWLVDPAVLDAIGDVARGNRPLALGAARSREPDPAGGTPPATARGRATTALGQLVDSIGAQDALVLGYSDPDVGALLRRRPGLLDRAAAVAQRSMQNRGLSGDAAVAPPEEVFDPRLVRELDPSTTLVLGDQGRLTLPPSSRLSTGQTLVLGDDRASAGGPAPGDTLDALALRQRVLAEAGLEAEKGRAAPRAVTVVLPPRWDPGTRWRDADFFGGLQTPWTRLTGVPRTPTTGYDRQVPWTASARSDEVPASNVEATRTLVQTGFTAGHLLTDQGDVTDRLVGAALQASSYAARPTPVLAAEQVSDLDDAVRAQLDRVEVTGTDFATLSGGSGIVTVSIINGLRQGITVGLRATPDSPDVKVDIPDPVSIQPGQRATMRLDVASRSGVHEVQLSPVTAQGDVLGTPLTFSLRTSQVGRAVWIVMIAAGALLAVMVVRRIVLRIRLRRWRVSEEQ